MPCVLEMEQLAVQRPLQGKIGDRGRIHVLGLGPLYDVEISDEGDLAPAGSFSSMTARALQTARPPAS
jgi:hypothetical protein